MVDLATGEIFGIKSTYQSHEKLGHGELARYSSNGSEIIEECKVCPQSFLVVGRARHFLPFHTAQRAKRGVYTMNTIEYRTAAGGTFAGDVLPNGIVGYDYGTQEWIDTRPGTSREIDEQRPGSARNPLKNLPARGV